MKMSLTFVVAIMCLFMCTTACFAWTDDVEGMLMPSARGEDDMSDPETILENIEAPADVTSGDAAPTIEWE